MRVLKPVGVSRGALHARVGRPGAVAPARAPPRPLAAAPPRGACAGATAGAVAPPGAALITTGSALVPVAGAPHHARLTRRPPAKAGAGPLPAAMGRRKATARHARDAGGATVAAVAGVALTRPAVADARLAGTTSAALNAVTPRGATVAPRRSLSAPLVELDT